MLFPTCTTFARAIFFLGRGRGKRVDPAGQCPDPQPVYPRGGERGLFLYHVSGKKCCSGNRGHRSLHPRCVSVTTYRFLAVLELDPASCELRLTTELPGCKKLWGSKYRTGTNITRHPESVPDATSRCPTLPSRQSPSALCTRRPPTTLCATALTSCSATRCALGLTGMTSDGGSVVGRLH